MIIQTLDRTPFEYEKLTITNAAVVRLTQEYRELYKAVFITIEDVGIRYRIDGGDPDADDGHVVTAGGNMYFVDPASLRDLRMIAIGQNDAIAIVTYYK